MKIPQVLIVGALFFGGAIAGCSKGDDGVPTEVTNEIQGLAGAAKAAGGNYDKLSEADKKKFVDRTGSEAGARQMVTQMASGPGARSK